MSQALQITPCCPPACDPPIVENIPGPQGEPGADGAAGADGKDSYTSTVLNFTQPAVGANVTLAVLNSAWAAIGQDVFVENGGYYLVINKLGPTSLTIRNLGYTANAAPGAVVPLASRVSPAGEKGAAGTNGSSASVPLTTKGDVLGYDSAPARFGVGTDGKVIAADSAQALGLNYVTIQPNSATDNAIARYDGTSGKPVPQQNSKVIITDDGALQASGTGGNARGTGAVDLQTTRSLATQVASGVESTIGGGNANIASGDKATVAGGYLNMATGEGSAIAGGQGNEASDLNTSVAGGVTNVASGLTAAIGGGSNNTASGDKSCIPGGAGAVADLYGQLAHGSGGFVNGGDAQTSELLWRKATTDATPTELFLDGASLRATITGACAWAFFITVIGREQTSGETAVWQFTGALMRNGSTTSLVSAVNDDLIAADAGSIASGWGLLANVTVTADDTNDSLKITVTGAVGKNIQWVAHARLVHNWYPT